MNLDTPMATQNNNADELLSSLSSQRKLVMIRGAGDIATGIAVRLYHCGYQIIMTDIAQPTMIRCSVSFGQCLYGAPQTVEGISAVVASDKQAVLNLLSQGKIPVVIDQGSATVEKFAPHYYIDAIIAKTNLGTSSELAPVTIALGPGFHAGEDCHAVIETNRGHDLGRVIYQGCTQANTGIPGNIGGYTHERVIRAPHNGVMKNLVTIGDIVTKNDVIAQVDDSNIYAPLSGMVRGLLNNGLAVTKGFKIADIDPRGIKADYTTVSDKARAIGGSVLEAMLHLSLATKS